MTSESASALSKQELPIYSRDDGIFMNSNERQKEKALDPNSITLDGGSKITIDKA
jgi:hypothetical protein